MQKKISVEFAMVREIPAEPTAESIRRKAMVSSLPQSFNVEVHSVYFSLATLSVVNKLKCICISSSCKVAHPHPSEVYVKL